jgi:hypothetical protein
MDMARTSQRRVSSPQKNSGKRRSVALSQRNRTTKLNLKPIKLTPEVHDVLQKVVTHHNIPALEAYVVWAILRSLEADVDYIFQGEIREEYIAKIENARKVLK